MSKRIDTIQTDRLFFRGIEEKDACRIVDWRSNPEVFKFFKSPHKISLKEHVDWYNNNYQYNENRADWICYEKTTGCAIGVFGLVRHKTIAEISYLLIPEAQHKGYATEGLFGLIEFASTAWGIHDIIAEIHKDNVSSINLVKRLGFILQEKKGDFVIYKNEA